MEGIWTVVLTAEEFLELARRGIVREDKLTLLSWTWDGSDNVTRYVNGEEQG